MHPFEHVVDKAVRSDISLLRTLLPFQATGAVAVAKLNLDSQNPDKSCTMLIFNVSLLLLNIVCCTYLLNMYI